MTPEILYKINLLAKIMFFVILGLRIVLGILATKKPYNGLKKEYKLNLQNTYSFWALFTF